MPSTPIAKTGPNRPETSPARAGPNIKATDGDNLLAVIRGSAVNNDGSLKVGFTAPSVTGQAEVISEALSAADCAPDTISYIEAHGTATALGDSIEIQALTKAFRAGTTRRQFCGIGSVKTNLGHLEAAAGVTSLIKTVLALQHQQILPSLNFEKPNPRIDFENSPFYVNDRLRDWPGVGSQPRRAGVSSFGFGSTNCHIVLEEAPLPERLPQATGRPFLLPLSARSQAALVETAERLAAYLDQRPETDLVQVAYSLQVGPHNFNERQVILASTVRQALAALHSPASEQVMRGKLIAPDSPVVFMFSGQGVQYRGMGRDLYRQEGVFRQTVDKCAGLLRSHLGLDLREILFPPEADREAAARSLTETALAQPALFTFEYALAKLWQSWGIRPSAMIGHSLGEYVAATLAGVFSLEDALKLVVPLAREAVEASLPNSELALAAINGHAMCGIRLV
jgi:acyl transferase domain-containing protein